ncbi:MAG: FecR domain-containing protein [Chitinophagaceae bacterium]|nr:FecR domain-containing protein [Chitinophagaceae bacterium]
MNIDADILAEWIFRYLQGTLSAEELFALEEWKKQRPENQETFDELISDKAIEKGIARIYEADASKIRVRNRIREGIAAAETGSYSGESQASGEPSARRVYFLRTGWLRYAAAAVIVLAIGIVYYFVATHSETEQPLAGVHTQPSDIAPGGDKAILTLADGTAILLDSAQNGALAQQGNAEVVKAANGRLIYNVKDNEKGQVLMNTMTTPRGGRYELTLPDGTRVWLNAASSITYPTLFVGEERRVTITGEAYFEVFKNERQPFTVAVEGKLFVEALGTHFNVNSYADEGKINTTLLEGSVRVSPDIAGLQPDRLRAPAKKAVILKPGQQAQVSLRNILVINDADIDQVMAWKNGFISIQDAGLAEVMKQLERWYDIQVRYEGEVPAVKFKGKMDRGVSLSGVLRSFSEFGIKTRLEGRTLVVVGN